MIPWLLSAALALPPDGLAALLPVGTGDLEGMSTSWDGDVVVGVDVGTKSAFLLHVEDWSVQTVQPCAEVLSVAYIGFEDHFGELHVGCADGLVYGLQWDPEQGALFDLLGTDGAPFTIDLGDPVEGLWYSSTLGTNGNLYGAYGAASSPVVIHQADSLDGTVDEPPFPLSLQTHSGFVEGALLADESTLVLLHGGQDLTTVTLSTGAAAPSQPVGVVLSPTDLFPSWNGGVYGVTNQGQLGEFVGGLWTVLFTGLDDPNAVIASFDPDDPWIAVTGGDVRVWKLDPDTGFPIGAADDPYFLSEPEPDELNWIQDGVASDGYLWGGGTAGYLHVASARPWVAPALLTVSPAAGTVGDVITVGFTVGEAGDWELRRGGDRGRTGVLLASGSVDAGASLSAEITIGSDWDEGTNAIYAFLLDDQGLSGHARTEVAIDSPPDAVVLRKPDLAFGDRKLVLGFDGLPDADLDHYEVYVAVAPFEPSDWPTDGPPWDGGTRLVTPIVVTAEPGASVTVEIQPLKNDVEHHVAVRAIDQGGLVGPMSNVLSETPRDAYSASELAGETGGGTCDSSGGAAGWLAIGGALLAGFRRRGLPLGLAALALSAPAHAQEGEKKGLQKDLTKQAGNFEMRYGGISIADPNIRDVYHDSQSNILQIEGGPQFVRFFEIDAGLGFFQELAFKVDAEGNQSGERTMLTWWPALSLDGTARLHLLDEQFVVPYARAGFDWVVWSEKWDLGTSKDVIRGSKFGLHYGLGGSLLLDLFDPRRASLLEAQTGINDTYLTFEWRKQSVDNRSMPWAPANRSGLDFSASMFTVGLKLDY